MATLTVMTYNILGARHPAALAHVVTTVAPDVIVVNETPKRAALWWWQRRIDTLLVRGAEVTSHAVPDLSDVELQVASDHRPVVATIRLGG